MVLASVVACLVFVACIWYFDPLFSWLMKIFASSPSEMAGADGPAESPEPLPRSFSFFFGPSDQRIISICIRKRDILIQVEKDIATIGDVDGEMKAIVELTKEIWGGLSPTVMAYLERKRSKVAELVTSLVAAQMRASKAEDEEAKARKHWQDEIDSRESDIEQATGRYRIEKEQAEQERKVADEKIAEVMKKIQEQTAQLNYQNAKLLEYVNANNELRQENQDMKDDRAQLCELLESMGQRIYKQAILLAKRAEKKS